MKVAAFVLLGMVVSVVVYILTCFYVLEKFLHIGGCAGMGPAFLIIMPISLLVGSIVTGFLSYPLLNTKWGLIGIAPGLYLVILTSFIFLPFGAGSARNILLTLLFLLYWYLASLAGVGLGYFLRARIRHLRKSD